MINKPLMLATVLIVLSGCAAPPTGPRPPSDPKQPGHNLPPEFGFDQQKVLVPSRCLVHVHIVDDEITVDHEPVQTKHCNEAEVVAVRWKLSEGAEYTFASNGIEFKAPQPPGVSCLATGPRVFRCTVPGHSGQSYRYTITVLKNGAPWKALDPTFVNN